MSNAVWFISFKLKKGVSAETFLLASEKCHNEVLSKQKGFISWEVLRNGDIWADIVKWETVEDAKNAETAGQSNHVAHEFYACLNMNSCKMQTLIIEKTH